MEQLICYRDFGLQSTSLNGFFFAFYVIVNSEKKWNDLKNFKQNQNFKGYRNLGKLEF